MNVPFAPWKADLREPPLDLPFELTLSTMDVDADDEGKPQDFGESFLEGAVLVKCETREEAVQLASLLVHAKTMWDLLRTLQHAPRYDSRKWGAIDRVLSEIDRGELCG